MGNTNGDMISHIVYQYSQIFFRIYPMSLHLGRIFVSMMSLIGRRIFLWLGASRSYVKRLYLFNKSFQSRSRCHACNANATQMQRPCNVRATRNARRCTDNPILDRTSRNQKFIKLSVIYSFSHFWFIELFFSDFDEYKIGCALQDFGLEFGLVLELGHLGVGLQPRAQGLCTGSLAVRQFPHKKWEK